MREKLIRTLPPIRVSEPLETALMRMAAHDERPLSEYIRRLLELHTFGHACMVCEDQSCGNGGCALRRDAPHGAD